MRVLALPATPDLIVPASITELFLSHGIIGAVALMSLGVAGFLYRAKEKQRTEYELVINAQRDKFEATTQKLQEDRIKEMRAGMSEIGKAIETVESTNKKFETVFEMMMKKVSIT